jgi:hypothetical protein
MLQKRGLCSANTECELATDSDSEGCKANRVTQTRMCVKKCSHNCEPVLVGTWNGDLHKEYTGLSTHFLGLPGVSTKMRCCISTKRALCSLCKRTSQEVSNCRWNGNMHYQQYLDSWGLKAQKLTGLLQARIRGHFSGMVCQDKRDAYLPTSTDCSPVKPTIVESNNMNVRCVTRET